MPPHIFCSSVRRNVANSENIQGHGCSPCPETSAVRPSLLPQCSPRISCFLLPRPLPFPQPSSLSPLTLAEASLAVTGSSPSCCCRQRYLFSGGRYTVRHKQEPHQAQRRAESRKFRWLLVYSWMCAPHIPVLLQYFCLPFWIVGELQYLLIPTVCGGGGGVH